jgi:hypothetical protein
MEVKIAESFHEHHINPLAHRALLLSTADEYSQPAELIKEQCGDVSDSIVDRLQKIVSEHKMLLLSQNYSSTCKR